VNLGNLSEPGTPPRKRKEKLISQLLANSDYYKGPFPAKSSAQGMEIPHEAKAI